MKKFKAKIYNTGVTPIDWYPVIEIPGSVFIANFEHDYSSRSNAKRAAERVAKKLNIKLEWDR